MVPVKGVMNMHVRQSNVVAILEIITLQIAYEGAYLHGKSDSATN